MGRYLGPGLLGLGVTAMIAGFMSGMAGNVSAFATVWTYDVYRPLFNRRRQRPPLPEHGPLVLAPRRAASPSARPTCCSISRTSEYLQVLIFFFIVPLFGVVILGMSGSAHAGRRVLGLPLAILVSIVMWGYVHSFPDGRRPTAADRHRRGAVVTLEKVNDAGGERIAKVIVERGKVRTVNVPIPGRRWSGPARPSGRMIVQDAAISLAGQLCRPGQGRHAALRVRRSPRR